jgi:ABC-type multidrug transport system permease subunit
MYNLGSSYGNVGKMNSMGSMGLGALIWTIITIVAAVAGCFLVYFLFVKKDVKTKNKFVLWLKDFLNFDIMLIEPILKIAYIFIAIFLTLESFALIGVSFVSFLAMLIGGNILARVGYEAALILVMIWKNTSELRKK